MSAQDLAGLHAPNRPFAHIPGGLHSYVEQLTAGQMRWAKLMFPEHRRADAQALRAQGFKILVRAPGEGVVYSADVRLMLNEFAGVIDWIEVGNEPPTDVDHLYQHCWYMAYILGDVLEDCHRAGIRLCAPGWTGNAEPPKRPAGNRRWDEYPANSADRLAARLLQVYGGWKSPDRLRLDTPGFDGIGFHAYGLYNFDGPDGGHLTRVKRWAATFPGMPLLGTEIGISALNLIPPHLLAQTPDPQRASRYIKAARLAEFQRQLAAAVPQVAATFVFIADNCTEEWQDDGRGHGFTLGDAWAQFGAVLTR